MKKVSFQGSEPPEGRGRCHFNGAESIVPHIVVWGSCFFAAPPRSSSSFLLLPPSSSLTTTSLTQHPTHNISHTTSLTTTSLRQHPTHTTSRTQHHSHNISHNNISHTTSLTQHPTHNVSHTTSLTQHPTHNITHITSPTRPLLAKGSDAKGSDVRPGVVWRRLGTGTEPVAFACCVRRLLLAKGSDVRPGVVWRRLGTGADFVAGAALCCLPRGRMYALASSGVGWAPAQISWQAQHFAACQGVGCTPWRRLASAGHRRRFRGRRSTLLLARGSDVRPGWAPAQISWQAQHFAACQGVGCTPWRRLASAGHRRRFRGRGSALLLAKGSPWHRLASSGVGWAPVQISWQAQRFAACQKGGCTPWRRLALAGHRRRFRGRRSTLLLAKGSDVRPGVVWRRLGTGADFVAGAALCEPPCADFVAGTASVELEAENWRVCSTTLVRGVSAGL